MVSTDAFYVTQEARLVRLGVCCKQFHFQPRSSVLKMWYAAVVLHETAIFIRVECPALELTVCVDFLLSSHCAVRKSCAVVT